jgi:hypothetical protein
LATIGFWWMHVAWLERTKGAQREVRHFIVVTANRDALGRHVIDNAVDVGNHGGSAVVRGATLDAGFHQRHLRTHEGHGLTLHVRTHQGAVGGVVFQERNHRCRNENTCNGDKSM